MLKAVELGSKFEAKVSVRNGFGVYLLENRTTKSNPIRQVSDLSTKWMAQVKGYRSWDGILWLGKVTGMR